MNVDQIRSNFIDKTRNQSVPFCCVVAEMTSQISILVMFSLFIENKKLENDNISEGKRKKISLSLNIGQL